METGAKTNSLNMLNHRFSEQCMSSPPTAESRPQTTSIENNGRPNQIPWNGSKCESANSAGEMLRNRVSWSDTAELSGTLSGEYRFLTTDVMTSRVSSEPLGTKCILSVFLPPVFWPKSVDMCALLVYESANITIKLKYSYFDKLILVLPYSRSWYYLNSESILRRFVILAASSA